MSHGTEQIGVLPLTIEEIKNLVALMKHPSIKKLSEEMKDKENKDNE